MKVVKSENKDGTVTLKASASPAEVSHAFNIAAGMFASQMGMQIDPSKPVIDQLKQVHNVLDPEAIVKKQAIEALVPFAIDKSGITPAYAPKAPTIADIENGKAFSFDVRVMPKPEYELTSYDSVSITIPPYTFPEEQLEAMVQRMAEDYAEYVTDDPRPVVEGDAIKIALRCSIDGEEVEQFATDGRTYLLGRGILPAEFDKELLGMNVGDKKVFSVPMPDGNAATTMMECTVTVLEMQKKVVSEVNDEWVSKYMPFYRDAAALRGGMRQRMEVELVRQYEEAKANMAAGEAAKRFKGSISDNVYESSRETLMNNLNAEVQQQGMTLEQFINQNGGQEQFGMQLMMQVRQMLVEGYTLDAVFRHEGLQLTDEDIDLACASMDPNDPAGLRKRMEENGYGFSLREAAQRTKAGRWLAEHAEVTIDESIPML